MAEALLWVPAYVVLVLAGVWACALLGFGVLLSLEWLNG